MVSLFLFILLLSPHLYLSSLDAASASPSPFQLQNTKTSSRKALLSSLDGDDKLPAPKKQKQSTSEQNLPPKPSNKKPILEDKLEFKKKLAFKQQVEKLISGADPTPKPLILKNKNKNKPTAHFKDPTDEIKPKKPKKANPTPSAILTRIKLSKPDTNTTNSNKITRSLANSTEAPISKTKLKQRKGEGTEDSQIHSSLLEETDGDDMMPDLPDLIEQLSITSKAYITAANSGIAEGVRPFLGSKFAQIVAPIASALFLVVPLLLLITLLKRLESCLSVVRHLLVFIQAYLAIYFATLAVTALVMGLEPLRFFYATSPSSYTWTQMAQSLGYVVYLVLQLVDLLAVFSSSSFGEGSRALALAQMLVGLAVGLHYYAAVFHRAVMGEPPRANWHVHGVYAMCFMLICACARAERRKKAYVGIEGTEEWKKS